MAAKQKPAGRRMIAYRVSEEFIQLLEALAEKLTSDRPGVQTTKTDVLELAVRELARKEKVKL